MLREQASRLSTALKRALHNFESGDDDPIVAMKTAIEHAVREDEDVLTALIFERLRYLPDALAWRIVVGAATVLRGDPPPFGGPLSEEVWPHLPHPADGTYVEPDVVWRSGPTVLCIEVKWKGSQTAPQLNLEYKALTRHVGSAAVVSVLALGGTTEQQRSQLVAECIAPSLLALDWSDLYRAVREARQQPNLAPTERVLDDMMAILAMRNPLWARSPLDFSSLPGWKVLLPLSLGPLANSGSAPPPPKAGPTMTGARSLCSLPSVQLALPNDCLPAWRRS